jgi:hypothetical protein
MPLGVAHRLLAAVPARFSEKSADFVTYDAESWAPLKTARQIGIDLIRSSPSGGSDEAAWLVRIIGRFFSAIKLHPQGAENCYVGLSATARLAWPTLDYGDGSDRRRHERPFLRQYN